MRGLCIFGFILVKEILLYTGKSLYGAHLVNRDTDYTNRHYLICALSVHPLMTPHRAKYRPLKGLNFYYK